jgi:hypothetical protein
MHVAFSRTSPFSPTPMPLGANCAYSNCAFLWNNNMRACKGGKPPLDGRALRLTTPGKVATCVQQGDKGAGGVSRIRKRTGKRTHKEERGQGGVGVHYSRHNTKGFGAMRHARVCRGGGKETAATATSIHTRAREA